MTTTAKLTDAVSMGDYWFDKSRDLSIEVTRWEHVMYDIRKDASEKIREPVDEVRKILSDHYTSKANHNDRDARAAALGASDFLGTGLADEIFARLYSEESAKTGRTDLPPWFAKVHSAVAESDSWEQLRSSVRGDADMSALAARRTLKTISEFLPALLEEDEQDQGGDDDGDGNGDGDGQGNGPSQAQQGLSKAMAQTAQGAMQEADDHRDRLNGLSPGLGHTPVSTSQQSTERLKLAMLLEDDPQLKDLVRKAGRIRRLSQANRMVPSKVARDTISGIEMGGDPSRILPSELVHLRHPQRRLHTLQKILDRRMMQYAYSGKERLGRGPVVVLLDESGSMSGNEHTWARAIGMACMAMARREGRDIKVAGFDTEIRHVHHIDRRGRGQVQMGNQSPSKVDGTEVPISLARVNCGGGTDFETALEWALDHGLSDDKADLIFVTDGQDCVNDRDLIERLGDSKARGLRVYGLTIGGGSIAESMQVFCDEVVDLDAVSDIAEGAAVISL